LVLEVPIQTADAPAGWSQARSSTTPDPAPLLFSRSQVDTLKWTESDRRTEYPGSVCTEGCEQLKALATRYADACGRVKPEWASVITYILVHEREHGLVVG
jgi:hypothetical protein